MTVRINKQKINLREKLAGVEDKVNFDEVVRGLGEYTAPLILNKDGGNVGIGTTNPVNALHVHGQVDGLGYIRITDGSTGSSAADGVRIGYNALGLRIQNYENTNISFFTNGTTEALTIKNDGKVGIGTANPGVKLVIEESSSDVVTQYRASNNYAGQIIGKTSGIFSLNGRLGLDFNLTGDQTSAMRIDSDGNVGIGTKDPGYKLDVHGWINAQADALSTDAVINLAASNANNYSAISRIKSTSESDLNGASSLTLSTRAANNEINEHMRIDSAGNVGIGTTNPDYSLSVVSNTNPAKIGIHGYGSFSDGSVAAQLLFLGKDSGGGNRSLAHIQVREHAHASGTGSMEFHTRLGGNEKARMTIDSAGNVGIGTMVPDAQLHLTPSSGDKGVRVDTLNNSTAPAFQVRYDNSTTVQILASGNSYFNGGNVGIGTTSPGAKLEVDCQMGAHSLDTDNFNQVGLLVRSSATAGSGAKGGSIAFTNVSGSGGKHASITAVQTDDDSNNIGLAFEVHQDGTSGDPLIEAMRIDRNGNVGIGTTNPGTHKLNVNGTTFCTSASWSGSDDRIKHNEQPIIGALETLSKITPKKYIKTTEMYDADHDFELDTDGNPVDSNGEPVEHRIEAGVIAQQVLTVDELAFAVSPEGVDEDGAVTSPHGLDYNSLFTYAIAAIQEQQQLINDLKSRIETLEQQ